MSQNYSLPGRIQVNIIYLNYLAIEWQRMNENFSCVDISHKNVSISDDVEKIIEKLILKISNYRISNDLIQIFSEIIISFMEKKQSDEKNVDDLADIFTKMMVGYKVPNQSSKMDI